MKKTISLFAILTASVLLNSCWIAPVYQDYITVGKSCYFKDYETMKAVTIPKINKSFTEWHWSDEEFDKKLEKYKDNIKQNDEDIAYMQEHTEYIWAVRNDSSSNKVVLKDGKTQISSEYYWITSGAGESAVFYKN